MTKPRQAKPTLDATESAPPSANPVETQPTLDGLELGDADRNGVMRNAVVKTIEALSSEGLLDARHTAMAQLALELGEALSRAKSSGKPYAIALVAGQLRDTLEALPAPPDAGKLELFTQLVGALNSVGMQQPALGETITIKPAT